MTVSGRPWAGHASADEWTAPALVYRPSDVEMILNPYAYMRFNELSQPGGSSKTFDA